MAFPGDVFGEKHIAGSKGLDRSIADTDLNGAGQGDAPLPARSGVPSRRSSRFLSFLKTNVLTARGARKCSELSA